RISRQRPGLVHGAERGHMAHEAARSAVGAHRESTPDHLAEARQVGADAVELLRAAVRDAESRDDLVEDEHALVGERDLAQPLEEAGTGRYHAHVAGNRLDDDGGDLAPALAKERAHGV